MTFPISPLKPDSLAFALSGAAQAIVAVQNGVALPQALQRVFSDFGAEAGPRGAIQDIAYRSMRQYGLTTGLLPLLCTSPPFPEELGALLIAALTLLADQIPAYDAFTVVNQAVEAASASPSMAHAKNMVNAVLRRFGREQEALLTLARKTPQGRWNYPAWWIDRVQSAYPQDWQEILQNGNQTPPLTLRVNSRRRSVSDYLDMLTAAGMAGVQIGPHAVQLDSPVPVQRLPGFADGDVSVQDAAAQLAAPLLAPQPGSRVLDACAAPGGKTGHLLELFDIELTALDHDSARLTRVADNLQRLQLQADLLCGDAIGKTWWDGRPFDHILADVPCTASGIVRRHPDIRWLRRKTDTAQLARQASAMLDNLWDMLAPGGSLLFITCSIWPVESELQARDFSSRHNALVLPSPGQLLPKKHQLHNHDGLFYALFQKA